MSSSVTIVSAESRLLLPVALAFLEFCDERAFAVAQGGRACSYSCCRMAASFSWVTVLDFLLDFFELGGRVVIWRRARLPASSITSMALSGR